MNRWSAEPAEGTVGHHDALVYTRWALPFPRTRRRPARPFDHSTASLAPSVDDATVEVAAEVGRVRACAHGRLGPLGAPLAPEVVALLNDPRGYGRSQAADAYWRITGNPRPVLPLLLTRAAPTTTYGSNDTAWYGRRDALRVLAGMRTAGALATTPPELRPLLELCATSPRRVTWKDDDELRRLARTLLDEPMPS